MEGLNRREGVVMEFSGAELLISTLKEKCLNLILAEKFEDDFEAKDLEIYYVASAIERVENCNAMMKETSYYTRDSCLFYPEQALKDQKLID